MAGGATVSSLIVMVAVIKDELKPWGARIFMTLVCQGECQVINHPSRCWCCQLLGIRVES